LTQLRKIDKNTFGSRHKNKPFKSWSQTHINSYFTITHARTTLSITHQLEHLNVGSCIHSTHDDGQEFMVAYANQSNNKTKAKYILYERECFIVIWVILSFWCYIYGNPFTLVTIHQSLKFLINLTRNWLDGTLFYRNIILILSIKLVGLTRISMDRIKTQVLTKRIPPRLVGT